LRSQELRWHLITWSYRYYLDILMFSYFK
jgi:hypothetical protein